MHPISVLLVASIGAATNPQRLPIPPEAKVVIRLVHEAASDKDYPALRRLMVSEFTWSFGGDGDAEQAIEAWKRDPVAMRELARVTQLHCSFRANENLVQCPANAGISYRAGFTKTEKGWRMSYFVAGD